MTMAFPTAPRRGPRFRCARSAPCSPENRIDRNDHRWVANAGVPYSHGDDISQRAFVCSKDEDVITRASNWSTAIPSSYGAANASSFGSSASLSEDCMQYKGIEYHVVQTANPTGWKWTVWSEGQS